MVNDFASVRPLLSEWELSHLVKPGVLADTAALSTGMSILNMTNVDLNLLSYLRCIDGEVEKVYPNEYYSTATYTVAGLANLHDSHPEMYGELKKNEKEGKTASNIDDLILRAKVIADRIYEANFVDSDIEGPVSGEQAGTSEAAVAEAGQEESGAADPRDAIIAALRERVVALENELGASHVREANLRLGFLEL